MYPRSKWDKFVDWVDDLMDVTLSVTFILIALIIFTAIAVLAIKLVSGVGCA